MIAIKEIMNKNLPKLSSLDSVESAVKAMRKMKSNYLLIEENGKLKGVVTSHELAGYASSKLILDCPIKPIAAISEKTLLGEALKVLKEKKVDFLVAINKQGTPIGATDQEMVTSFLYQELEKSNIEKEEHKEEDKALIVSETRYRRLFETAQDGILILDAGTGTIIDVNPFLMEMLGYSHEQFIGKTIWELGSLKDIIPNRENFLELQRQEYIRYEDLPLETSDGRYVDVEFVSNVYLVDHKKVIQCNIRNITERKEAEEVLKKYRDNLEQIVAERTEAMRESSEKLRVIFDSIGEAITVVDLQSNIIDANQEALRLHGFQRKDELIGRKASELVVIKDRDRVVKNAGKALKEPDLLKRAQYKLLTKDGREFDGEFCLAVFKDKSGQPAGFIGLARDISEHKKADETLRESEEKYRILAETCSDGILVTDEKGILTYVNPALEQMYDIPASESLGTSFSKYATEESALSSAEVFLELALGERKFVKGLELDAVQRDGCIFPIEVSASAIIRDGKFEGVECFVRDITERKRAEEALRETEERYKSLFNRSLEAIYISDLNGNFTDANPYALELLGYEKEDIASLNFLSLVDNEGVEIVDKISEEIIRTGSQRESTEYKVRKKDGTYAWIVTNASLLYKDGKPVGIQGIARDITESKQAEETLKKSKEYFKEITENSSDMIIITDKNGDIKYCSRSVERFTGYKPEELTGKSAFNFIHPDDVQRAVGDFGKAILTKDVMTNAFRIVHKDGSERYFDGQGRNLLDNPSIVGFIMNIRDVTGRKKAEEAFKKKAVELEKAKTELESFSKGLEEKVKERTAELAILSEVSNAISYTVDYQILLKLIMESLFKIVDYDICGSLLFDANTTNITLVPAYPDSTGLADEIKGRLIEATSTLRGRKIQEKQINVVLIPPNPDVKPREPNEERQYGKIRSFFNVPFVVRGEIIGMINVSSCCSNAFSEDNIKLIYAIANQAANAIERLQTVIIAEKSKMESMVASMIEGVIMIDRQGGIVVLNPQCRHMLGFNLTEEVTSEHLTEKMKVIGLYDAFQECQDIKGLAVKEVTVTQGEESAVLRCDISPVKGANAEIIGIVIILEDITREKETDRLKTEFVSTVSHELRTPLTIIKEFTSIISDGIPGKLTKEQKEYMGIIKGNIDRLTRLINDLLDISKIEAGKVELKRTLVDVIDLATATIAALKPEAQAKHLEFKTLFPNSTINVYADPDKLIQIFTNLIGNAVKFTQESGEITVEIKDKDKEVECSVADTGKGIAPEDMGKLFTKFQQFGRVDGAGAKGTGLGLAISKELVQSHNGKIWAESRFGEGTKFTFTLPKYTSESLFEKESLFEGCVNTGIKGAMKSDSQMSIIMVSILEFEKLKQELSVEKLQSVLKGMEGVLAKGLRRRHDVALKDDEMIVVLLTDCNKESVLKVEDRLEQVLEDYLTRQELDEKIELQVGCATYPDEAKDAEGLISKARKVMVRR
jgi:PAS domain S-box-containing protein